MTCLAKAVSWQDRGNDDDALDVRTWCGEPLAYGTDIVFEAALSDCGECMLARSKALNAVRPKRAPEFDVAFHEAVNKKLGED